MTEPRATPGELLQGLISVLAKADVFLRQTFDNYDDSPLRRCYQLAAGELASMADAPGMMSQDRWLVVSARSYLNIRESSTIPEQKLRLSTELRQLADFIDLIPLRPSTSERSELLRESILTLASAVDSPPRDATVERLVEKHVGDSGAASLLPAILVASGPSETSQEAALRLIDALSDPSLTVIDLTTSRAIASILREVESAECSEAYSVLVLDKNDTNDLNSFNCTEYEPFILFGILLKTAKHIRTYLALEGDGSESKDTKFEPVADHLYWSQKQDGEKTTFMVTHVASALRTAALNRTSN